MSLIIEARLLRAHARTRLQVLQAERKMMLELRRAMGQQLLKARTADFELRSQVRTTETAPKNGNLRALSKAQSKPKTKKKNAT